jgi:hypothetical protein
MERARRRRHGATSGANQTDITRRRPESRWIEIRAAFGRGIHVGRFIRWVEGGNQ